MGTLMCMGHVPSPRLGSCYLYVNLIKVKELKARHMSSCQGPLPDLLRQSSLKGACAGDILILGGGVCGAEGPQRLQSQEWGNRPRVGMGAPFEPGGCPTDLSLTGRHRGQWRFLGRV